MKKPFSGSDIFCNRDTFFRVTSALFLSSAAFFSFAVLLYLLFLAANAHTGQTVRFFYPRIFSDFTQVAYYSVRRDAYLLEGGSSYSAISLLLMLPFACIFRNALRLASYSTDWSQPNMEILSSPCFWIAFLLYQAAAFSLLYFLLRRLMEKRPANGAFLCFAFSAGSIYALIRGNTLLFPLAFVLLFLNLYDSKKALYRETGLFFFALAGAMKLYPLFFGCVLLHRKRWGAALRGGLYFLALYFLPLFCYEGGFSAYSGNLLVFIGGENHLADGSNISLASLLYKIFSVFFADGVPAWAEIFSVAAGGILLLFLALAATVTKSRFRQSVLSLCAVSLVAPVGYFYVTVFSLIPAAEYLKTYDLRTQAENKKFFFFCLALGFYPIYAAWLFPVACILLTGLGISVIKRVFRAGEVKAYFSRNSSCRLPHLQRQSISAEQESDR